jgi:hypothetical protein
MTRSIVFGSLAAIALLAGCGAPAPLTHPVTPLRQALLAESLLRVPGPQDFTTIHATVTQLLPDTNHGLPHQNFVVREDSPSAGLTLEVNNDEKFGTRVPNLQAGEALVIRGILYHDPNKDGIHWTHHTNVPGDAGFIQTPDGHVYQ